MKFLYLFVLIAVTKSSFQDAEFAGRIVEGLNALSTDNFVFRFLSVDNVDATDDHVSTGVAISPDIGLVVAQAVEGFEFFYIGFGSINVEDHDIQSIPRNNIISHGGYDPITLRDNIAVLKFTTPVSNYIPVAVTPLAFPIRIVFGYGLTDISSTTPTSVLQQLILLLTAAESCVGLYDDFDSGASICAISPSFSALTIGDQGGPIVDQTRYFVQGLTSYWGASDHLVGVDLIHYTPFIDASIAALL